MIWFLFALGSAVMLGFYDVFKKQSLRGNAVFPVLFCNTLISTCLFLPVILLSAYGSIPADSHWYVPGGTLEMHLWVMLKSVIVLSSWICGYFAMKYLPLTLVGPVNATRPVFTLVGALVIFGEHLNLWQWAGVIVALVAFVLLKLSAGKEGIRFTRNRWVFLLIAAALLGACSGLYDKYLLSPIVEGGRGLPAVFVQSWFNLYQVIIMTFLTVWWWRSTVAQRAQGKAVEGFEWRWTIVGISLFLVGADLCYFYALSQPGALIAVVSMTRRSSVLVSFLFGAYVFHERNVKSKALDLLLVFLSLILLSIGAL